MENIASVGKRVLGCLIDIVLLMAFFVVYVMIFGTKTQPYGHVEVHGIMAIILYVLMFLYFIVLEAKTGKTVGKYVVKMKVVNAEGNNISWGQAIARTLMRIIDGLFFYLVGFIAALASSKNQRLGDMVAKTYVIND